jgi:hypothetical protein
MRNANMKNNYTTLEPVRHDGKDLAIGSTLALEDDQATDMLALKAIALSTGNTPVAPTDPDIRHAKICEAIGMLDTSNAELWLSSGKPDLAALVEITGWSITASERDAAWAEVKPAV